MPKRAQFRFYEELNDFLTCEKKKKDFSYYFWGNPSIKDAIEAIGVPHTEVDLVLVNGKSVAFSYKLQDEDAVAVYPEFESLDISNVTHLREKPLREPKFILDTHLGKLARYLRMLGFDTLYKNDFNDAEIVQLAIDEKRIILTRDVVLLKAKTITRGYWLRSTDPDRQLTEVLNRFNLFSNIDPFHRCMICNGIVTEAAKESVKDRLLPKTKEYYNEFFQCSSCQKIYWKGSHYENMGRFIERVLKQ